MKAIGIVLVTLVLSWMCTQGQEISQEVVSSSGDCFDNSSGQLSWTLGELATETYEADDATLIQGFQQPIYEVATVFENTEYNNLIQVYPVPSSDFITVEFEEIQDVIQIVLYNLQGEIISTKQGESATVTLDLNNLSRSEYILKIMNKEKNLMKSYKIIKH